MAQRVLVDTDLLLERQPFFPAATRLFQAFEEGKLEGFVSSLAFANLFYVLRKHIGGPRAITILRKLRLITSVLTVEEKTIDRALASTFSDFEDAIQYYSALEVGLDAIVTRNDRDYKSAAIAVVTAEACLEGKHSAG